MAGQQYIRERERQEQKSRTTGAVLTIGMHALIAICCLVSGFTYLDPPPPEREQILIDFAEPVPQKPKQTWSGTRPRAETPSKETELVQKSQAQHIGTKSNEAPETEVDDFGDVDIKNPAPKKEIDRRALFRAADNKTQKDTLAAQTAREVSDALKAGHALGNTKTGNAAGEPKANLKGRDVVGVLVKPAYKTQTSGKVVVNIAVDQNGQVIEATIGDGCTITDGAILNAARKAAMETHFTPAADVTKFKQYGTITYIFRLN